MSKNIPKQPLLFGIFVTKPHKKWAILALTFVFLAEMLDRFMVLVLRNLTDAIAAHPVHIDSIWMWGIAYPVLFLIAECVWRGSGFTGMRWFTGMRSTIYQTLYEYLSLHSKDYFNNRFAGALTNKISNAVEGSDNLFARMLWNFLPLALGLIWYTIFAGLSDWRLGLIIIMWAAMFLGINIFFVTRLQPYSYKSAKSLSTLKGRLVDSLSNMSLIQEYAHLAGERKYINKFIKHQQQTGFNHWWFSEWMLVANGAFIALFMLAMISSSIYLFQQHLVSIGVVVMAVAMVSDLASQFFFIGQEMSNATRYYGEIKEGLEEILHQHAIADAEDASSLTFKQGTISFNAVSFYYENTNIFENLSLTIHGGQKVGLVGKSGAGKSTFISLLLRHFDVAKGSITIDDKNTKEVTLESLRRLIAYVPQDSNLFHRTIRENIMYGSPQATMEQIKHAAKLAQADTFIEKLPHNYETLVGERGVKLSGGQRQRVAIARAFLKNAPILILDEATSSLDSASEQAIQQSLEKLMQGRTVIAIAHRLSTLKKMNRIIVIEEGKIVEDGNPNELLKNPKSIFKNMWDHQIKGFIVDK